MKILFVRVQQWKFTIQRSLKYRISLKTTEKLQNTTMNYYSIGRYNTVHFCTCIKLCKSNYKTYTVVYDASGCY